MDINHRLAISYYETIATINESHKVYLVQHRETKRLYIKKILDVYNINVYKDLYRNPIIGIPRIIDYCEEDRRLVLIEEYISGCSLEEKIQNVDFTQEDIISYIVEICSILEKLHSLPIPIIHRDIKPSNLIVTSYNHIVLLDFNAAKLFRQTEGIDTVLLGTEGYAAPEQYGFGFSSPLTDIYSTGVVLQEMLAAINVTDRRFVLIAEKCTQLSPGQRYQTATELKEAIQKIKKKDAPKQKTASAWLPPGYRTKTPWKMIVASGVYLFLLWASLTLEIKEKSVILVWAYRWFTLLVFLFVIIGSFNYLNIQRIIPLCKSKNSFLRFLGIAILDAAMVLILFVLLVAIEGFLSL